MNRRKRQQNRLNRLLVLVPFILAAAAILIVLFGFQIRSMQVVGNSMHTADAIRADLVYDFKTENTLYFAWKYKAAGYEPRTPYLSSVQARMTSPGKIVLTVEEKKVIGYVQYSGNIVSFDADGTILDISDTVYENTTLVTGITMDEPVLYQKLPLGNTALLRTMLSITKLMNDASLSPDSIEFDDNYNITVVIGSVTVELGQDEYLEEKTANLEAIYPQIKSQTGTLNMTAFTGKNETITFRENDETEAVTESAEDVPDTEGGEDAQTPENGTDAGGDAGADETAGGDADVSEDTPSEEVDTSQDTTTGVMAFDSSGTLHYDAHISGGQVVDGYGNPIDGCTVTEEGYIRDAYWNVIDPNTGSLMNG